MTPELRAAYAEPHRRYHTQAHIDACLAQLARLQGLSASDRRTLECAIWWHDAVYDPRRSDNEDVSADMAVRDLRALGESEPFALEVARLIRLTKGHQVQEDDHIGALLVSIDLSILGAPPEDYDGYVRGVRYEYGFVPDEAFRAGRAAVLRHFLDAKMIFPDPEFAARLEVNARNNLSRELGDLTKGGTVAG